VFVAVFRKTIGDLSELKMILAYLITFLSVLFFLSIALTNSEVPDGVATLPLGEQEVELLSTYLALSWFWAVGIALLAAGAIFVALTLATEAERGTLDLLLSKPVRRWKVLLAIFVANVAFLFAVGVASLLLVAVTIFEMGGFSAAAIGAGVFDILPGLLLYTLVVCALVSAIGIAASVVTRKRLQTAALTALAPVLFFAMFVARVFPGETYEDYSLYLIDIGYHLGNVCTLIFETTGVPFSVEAQAVLGFWAGVYDVPEDLGSVEGSLELIGYVDPGVSLALCLCLTVGLLVFSLVRFRRMDV